ncbi:unnamed protein product [Amoebophrya sp. A25]|nr:unnamed protein product [Amoebophrya sp. A25]|eukprot:GSA25T00017642001.1
MISGCFDPCGCSLGLQGKEVSASSLGYHVAWESFHMLHMGTPMLSSLTHTIIHMLFELIRTGKTLRT